MRYVFEDNGNDIFSKLFKYAYPEEVSSEFIYTHGSTRIESIVEPLIKDGECVTVFMDLVPDNEELVKLYRRLSVMSRDNCYRLVVITIPCVEYEFILSVKDMISNEFTDRCISYSDYSDLIETINIDEGKRITTFERYCKAVVKHKMLKCMSTDTRINNEYMYFTKDCDGKTLRDKSLSLLMQYPVIPYGITDYRFESVSGINLWDTHRKCIDLYNDAVIRFNIHDRASKCKMLKPIK